ncbi:MAG: hypothetical protein Q4C87_11360 [Actinomycetaceae bacterium]|nr:hypothetical protein [Actinomycetaceae bacterium]
MTIVEEADPAVATLIAAARDEQVQQALAQADQALTRLRFHEGLRRRWAEARAEVAIREAVALSLMEGARTTVNDLRHLTLTFAARSESIHEGGVYDAPPRTRDADGETRAPSGTGEKTLDPGNALALGIWQSQWELASTFPPLNTRTPISPPTRPLPSLLSGLHRDICAPLARRGLIDSSTIAIPRHPAALMVVRRYLDAPVPAMVHAAAAVAHFRRHHVFYPASAPVGAALARWLLVTKGVDPTGCAVISGADGVDMATGQQALAGWASAGREGVAMWLTHFAHSVSEGARIGEDIALRVQAGSLGE